MRAAWIAAGTMQLMLLAFVASGGQDRAKSIFPELPDRAWGVHCQFRVFPQINEASGAALTTNAAGDRFYWSLGDSGNPCALGRTNLRTLSTERIAVASPDSGGVVHNEDWESLSVDDDGRLWIIDGGANNAPRSEIQAYQVDPNDSQRPLKVIRTVRIAYPSSKDPAEHPDDNPDVEAAFIHGDSLYLIEKSILKDMRVYAVALGHPTNSTRVSRTTAARIGILPARARCGVRWVPVMAVTDACRSSTNVYLLTYFSVYHCPLAVFDAARRHPAPDAPLGGDLDADFSVLGSQGRPVQTEGLAAISDNEFLISREDGRVFLWRDGGFVEPEPKPTHKPPASDRPIP